MEEKPSNKTSFHLAGVVPVAGQKLDFNMPWHDSMQPIAKNYLAVERAVWECACAGCETIWIVCNDDMQPLIRYRLGDYVNDPIYHENNRLNEYERQIPIYYVPLHPKDLGKRDCLSWSVLYGALTSHWLSRRISLWVVPDKFYVTFPYGVYDPEIVKPYRKQISNKKPFFISHEGKTIKDGEYLGFTFDPDDFKKARRTLRKEGTGETAGYKQERLPVEKRWSARFFKLDKVFHSVKMEGGTELKTQWYYNIDSWDRYRIYIASKDCQCVQKPSRELMSYHEWNPIGVDDETEE
jgi:hypothetical protein